MFLVNGMKATLIQYNRNNEDSIYDDEDQKTVTIKICPYNVDNDIIQYLKQVVILSLNVNMTCKKETK